MEQKNQWFGMRSGGLGSERHDEMWSAGGAVPGNRRERWWTRLRSARRRNRMCRGGDSTGWGAEIAGVGVPRGTAARRRQDGGRAVSGVLSWVRTAARPQEEAIAGEAFRSRRGPARGQCSTWNTGEGDDAEARRVALEGRRRGALFHVEQGEEPLRSGASRLECDAAIGMGPAWGTTSAGWGKTS